MIRIGSLFAGIGGFELGLERAIPQSKTIWQVEQNLFCQSILKKHWKDAVIFDDVCTVGKHNLPEVDLLCGGFPCQDISIAGKKEGINEGKKSSLYWQMYRIISELRPRVVVLENVANVIRLGGHDVLRTLASAGYDAEWCTIRTGADFGLPHIRRRWFCIAYPSSNCEQQSTYTKCMEQKHRHISRICKGIRTDKGRMYRKQIQAQSPVCRDIDGIPKRMDRCKALGNAITPQASEWIGMQIYKSGLLDDLYK